MQGPNRGSRVSSLTREYCGSEVWNSALFDYINRSVTWVNTLSAVCPIERWFENVFATSQTPMVFVDFFNGAQIMLNLLV